MTVSYPSASGGLKRRHNDPVLRVFFHPLFYLPGELKTFYKMTVDQMLPAGGITACPRNMFSKTIQCHQV